jgi:hypothetical protein
MPDHRKPPLNSPSGSRSRSEPLPATPADSGGFSIESTTMRLKSMRLRRAEVEKQGVERAAPDKSEASGTRGDDRPAGRVRHDERGMAVWDWAVASGEFQALSATRAMKKLEVADLQIAETRRDMPQLSLEKAGRDVGGGFDPYNQRGSGKRVGEAATRQGVTGSKQRDPGAVLDQLTGKKK